jgi:WD40 repeat protein
VALHPPAAFSPRWHCFVRRKDVTGVGTFGGGVYLGNAGSTLGHVVLTCAHVIDSGVDSGATPGACGPITCSFPFLRNHDAVLEARCARISRRADLALLTLLDDVPPESMPAAVVAPLPDSFLNSGWTAVGHPDGEPVGETAAGQVGHPVGANRYELKCDIAGASLVRGGFSGSGVWSSAAARVIGLLVQERHAVAKAQFVSLEEVLHVWPDMRRFLAWKLAAEPVQTQRLWAGSLTHEELPLNSSAAYQPDPVKWVFRGRARALSHVAQWTQARLRPGRPLTITGNPGSGKSALLARLVVSADDALSRLIPVEDSGPRLAPGSVVYALNVKHLGVRDVVRGISSALGAGLPESAEDAFAIVTDALARRAMDTSQDSGFLSVLVIDALDEMSTGPDAVALARLLRRIAERGRAAGYGVIVGTRRGAVEWDGSRPLLRELDVAATNGTLIDLDDPPWTDRRALESFVLGTLTGEGSSGASTAYSGDATAPLVATAIAEVARGNFLVGGLVAQTRAMVDAIPMTPEEVRTTGARSLHDAFAEYIAEIEDAVNERHRFPEARGLLTALAFAERPGFPAGVWCAVARRFRADVSPDRLAEFMASPAAGYIIANAGPSGDGAAMIFHEALAEYLRNETSLGGGNRSRGRVLTGDDLVFEALLELRQDVEWDEPAGRYIRTNFAAHAARARRLEDLFADVEFLVRADEQPLRRLLPRVLSRVDSAPARALRLALSSAAASTDRRIALRLASAQVGATEMAQTLSGPGPRVVMTSVQVPHHLAALTGHENQVQAITSFRSVAGVVRLVTGSRDGTVRVWDPEAETPLATLVGHSGAVADVAVSLTGAGDIRLVSVSDDGTLRVWAAASEELLHVVHDPAPETRAVSCWSDSRLTQRCVTAGSDGKLRVWDLEEKRVVATFVAHAGDGVRDVTTYVAPSGDVCIASVGDDATLRIWDSSSQAQLRTLVGHGGSILAVAAYSVGSEGVRLVTAGTDSTVRVWDALAGEEIACLMGHDGWIRSVATLTTDNGETRVVSVGDDKTVRIWDPSRREQAASLTGHDGWIRDVAVYSTSNGETRIATAGDDKTVQLWAPGSSGSQLAHEGHTDWVRDVMAYPASATEIHMVSVSADRTVRIWRPGEARAVAVLRGHTGWVRTVAWFRDRSGSVQLVTGAKDGTLRIWDPTDRKLLATLPAHTGDGVWGVATYVTSTGDPRIVSVGDDATVRIWDPHPRVQLRAFVGHEQGILDVATYAVAPGEVRIVTASKDRTVRVWDAASGEETASSSRHKGWVRSVAVFQSGPGEVRVVSVGDDKTIRVWDPETQEEVASLRGHTGWIRDVAVFETSAGERCIATASNDMTVRIWGIHDHELRLTLPIFSIGDAVAPGPEPDSIVVGSAQGFIIYEVA